MNGKNYLSIIILTLFYAFLLFYRIGCPDAPESFLKLTASEQNAIQLDFGKNVRISEMEVYLGYQSNRTFSVWFYEENGESWMKLQEEQKIKSPFCWNSTCIDIGKASRYLYLASCDEEAQIHEIVFLDEKGNRILPVNVGEYPMLFDEQELYPEYATYYYNSMFDEIYHGRTAYELIHDLPLYEISHPPLGKLMISLGIRFFGMTPFGWRFSSAVMGILLVPVIYCFAWKLWHDSRVALFCSILHCTEFMHFTLSRIATIDIHIAFFVIQMFLFMYCFLGQWFGTKENRKKEFVWLLLCGVSTGCAIATKWTGFYAAAGLAVLLFMALAYRLKTGKWNKTERSHCVFLAAVCLVCFIVIPFAIYMGSYLPYLSRNSGKGLLTIVIENAQFMLDYHRAVKTAHPFESLWYEWVIDRRPLWDSVTRFADGTISSISTFGNPLILWSGIAAVIYNIYLFFLKKEKRALFLSVAYFSMLIPWLFVHRTVFIYQYFICTIFLILIIGNALVHRRKKYEMSFFLCLSVLLFLMFYPQLSGMQVPVDYTRHLLQWFPTWKFV
ncbi:MAG: phospholipid carrier-dependent glycosyltransferase [Lachnospiraceae bacterium]|nr:phospholipid carrier-dependent glycosyltransferase [Lachnospiraceae bacterium]